MKYPALYEELDNLDAELSEDIAELEGDIDEHRRKQLLLEQDLAGKLLLRSEIRQLLKDSAMTEI